MRDAVVGGVQVLIPEYWSAEIVQAVTRISFH